MTKKTNTVDTPSLALDLPSPPVPIVAAVVPHRVSIGNEIVGVYFGDLTELEGRILWYCLAQCHRQNTCFEYRAPIDELIAAVDTHNYPKYVIDAIDSLMGKCLVLDRTNKRSRMNWLIYREIDDTTKTINIAFNPYLNQFLIGLQNNFTSINFKTLISLSNHAARLYYYIKQQVGYGNDSAVVDVDLLRWRLAGEKYHDLKDFTRYVLKASITEICSKTDIQVTYRPVRSGRKITKIAFSFHQKQLPKEKIKHQNKNIAQISERDKRRREEEIIRHENKRFEDAAKKFAKLPAEEQKTIRELAAKTNAAELEMCGEFAPQNTKFYTIDLFIKDYLGGYEAWNAQN